MYYNWDKYSHNDDEEFDSLFKEAAQNYHPEYQEEDWDALEELLEQKQKKIGVAIIQQGGIILLGILVLMLSAGFWSSFNLYPTKPQVILESQVSDQSTIDISKEKLDKEENKETHTQTERPED